jgi:hypothetical protein
MRRWRIGFPLLALAMALPAALIFSVSGLAAPGGNSAACPTCTRDPATLTITDSAGQTDSDAQFVVHIYPD